MSAHKGTLVNHNKATYSPARNWLNLALAARLQRERKRNGFSQSELASRAGVSAATVAHFESDPSKGMYMTNLYKICKALGADMWELMGSDPAMFRALRLVELRTEHSLTMPEVATLTGVSDNTLYAIEKGKVEGGIDVWRKIAEGFGVSMDTFTAPHKITSPAPHPVAEMAEMTEIPAPAAPEPQAVILPATTEAQTAAAVPAAPALPDLNSFSDIVTLDTPAQEDGTVSSALPELVLEGASGDDIGMLDYNQIPSAAPAHATVATVATVAAEDASTESNDQNEGPFVGDTIRAAREARGWSRNRLSEMTGIGLTILARFEESPLNGMYLTRLVRIAQALDLDLWELLNHDSVLYRSCRMIQLRMFKSMTQEDLARAAGVGGGTISYMEQGLKQNPALWEKVAAALDVPRSEFDPPQKRAESLTTATATPDTASPQTPPSVAQESVQETQAAVTERYEYSPLPTQEREPTLDEMLAEWSSTMTLPVPASAKYAPVIEDAPVSAPANLLSRLHRHFPHASVCVRVQTLTDSSAVFVAVINGSASIESGGGSISISRVAAATREEDGAGFVTVAEERAYQAACATLDALIATRL